MKSDRAHQLARAMVEVGHFSSRVSAEAREALLEPLSTHLASLPEPEDHVAAPRVSGAALLIVSGGMLWDTELREHEHGEVRTTGHRLSDEALAVGLDSQPGDNGSRRTVWHFRFRSGGQVEIAGQSFETDGGAACDEAEGFARRLAARAGS